MTMSGITAVRRGLFGAFATCVLGGVTAATIAIPSAGAQPGCQASDFSHTASGVLASAGGWLDAHQEANDVLSSAGMQGAGAPSSRSVTTSSVIRRNIKSYAASRRR